MWDGYPFLLSAAIGDIEDNIILVVSGYNSAGSLQASHESNAASYTDSVIHFSIGNIYTSSTESVSYFQVYIKTELEEVITDTLIIDLLTPCENPVYLLGRNSSGGSLQWMFDVNQELSFDYGNDSKAKRLLLTAVNISSNEWDVLNEFITLGVLYKHNITEFTSSTIKTSSRVDQQVYDVDSDGNKTGVIVIPTKNNTKTKRVRHMLEMEIEYPEIF